MDNTMSTASDRQNAVRNGLLPILRIADQPVKWTMEERLAHYGCPGVGVAVMKGGEIDWSAGFGVRELGQPAQCDADTVFMVASCSKPVAALVAMMLVERGVLDLDRPVNDYLKRWQLPGNEFTARTPVTLRRALSHTAGLTVNGWGVTPRDGSPVPTTLDLLNGKHPTMPVPVVVNKHYDGHDRYSGGGFVITQLIVEDLLGRTFDDVAREFIFEPLGMTNTTYTQPLPAAFHGNVASGHGDDGQPYPGGWMLSSEMAAGGLFSSANDYAKFLLACRAAFLGEKNSLITQSTAHDMMTRFDKSAFGLGFHVLGDGDAARINHGGSNDGYQSETNLYLESGDGGVVLTNATSGLFLYREILNGIADVYDWKDFMPAPKRLKQMTREDFDKYIGTYRITMGIEMPVLNVWEENGRLYNEIPGLRTGVQETFCDVDGVLLSPAVQFETYPVFGADGRVQELRIMDGTTQIMGAVRVDE